MSDIFDENVKYEFVDDDKVLDENPEPIKAIVKKPEPIKAKVKIVKPTPEFKQTKWYIALYLIAVILYTHAVYSVVVYHYDSYEKHYQNQIIYPINSVRGYNTKSRIFKKQNHNRLPLFTILKQLQLHLTRHPEYIVLCMHHLELPQELAKNVYQICVLYNRGRSEFIDIINPEKIGESLEKRHIVEHSVSCSNSTLAHRNERLILQWQDMENELYSVFKHDESIALQVAMDEMQGNKHCKV